MLLCRDMDRGLVEILSKITDGGIAHVLFAVVEGKTVLLHGFIKQTPRIKARAFSLAMKRFKEGEQ